MVLSAAGGGSLGCVAGGDGGVEGRWFGKACQSFNETLILN